MHHPELAALLTTHKDRFVKALAALQKDLAGTIYAGMTDTQRLKLAENVADNFIAHFNNTQPIEEFAQKITSQRVRDPNYTPDSIEKIIRAIDIAIKQLIDAEYPEISDQREKALDALNDAILRDTFACYTIYSLERERALKESTAEQAHLIDMLRDLSSPIIPVHDSILVLPIVGAVDTGRAQIIMEDLLSTIVEQQADLVIIDITGMPLVDTAIANYLLQTTKAVNLLGAHTILVGIRAEVAQTLVGLDIDLRSLTIRANLQDGIAYALGLLGLQIQPMTEESTASS